MPRRCVTFKLYLCPSKPLELTSPVLNPFDEAAYRNVYGNDEFDLMADEVKMARVIATEI